MSVSATGETINGAAGQSMRLLFEGGTLVVEGPGADDDPNLPGVKFDQRTRQYRAEAIWYRTIVEHVRRHKQPYTDTARAYEPSAWRLQVAKEAFPHQVEGLNAWWQAGGRGVVVLPTGTGKTHLANMAIERVGRPTLVITPTIDLMNQWYDELDAQLRCRRRAARRRLLRHPAPHRDDLRLGLSQHGSPGQPLWTHRFRRVPPPARPDLWPGRHLCDRPLSVGAHRHARAGR